MKARDAAYRGRLRRIGKPTHPRTRSERLRRSLAQLAARAGRDGHAAPRNRVGYGRNIRPEQAALGGAAPARTACRLASLLHRATASAGTPRRTTPRGASPARFRGSAHREGAGARDLMRQWSGLAAGLIGKRCGGDKAARGDDTASHTRSTCLPSVPPAAGAGCGAAAQARLHDLVLGRGHRQVPRGGRDGVARVLGWPRSRAVSPTALSDVLIDVAEMLLFVARPVVVATSHDTAT